MLTHDTYDQIQERLSRKQKEAKPGGLTGKREEGYVQGILAAKSIIKEIYEHQKTGGILAAKSIIKGIYEHQETGGNHEA